MTQGSPNPATATGPHDVAILVSRPNFGNSQVEVVAYSGSSNAPSLSAGEPCAQALADLLKQQFRIAEIVTGGNPSVTEYILVRPRG